MAAIMLPTAEAAWTKPERIGPRPRRHDLGHQRHAHRELSAHAQAAQEAEDVEVPDAGGEHAQAGEDRVAQDRDGHRLDAADAVAQDAEEDAADGPPDHEDRGGPRRLLVDGRVAGAARPSSSLMAGLRARLKSCCAMVSNIQPMLATLNTNQW